MGTDVAVRGGLDLTRAPDAQWNAEMVDLVTRQLFRNLDVSVNTVRYCLAIAESLDLNPLIGEVYFIPSKSQDGKGPAYQPYIGRNGLVARATERGYYYESDTVCREDKFRINRRRNGDVEVTHSYDPTAERGDVVGAYAFLHKTNGSEKPAFFWAKLSQYMPTYDQEWKLAKSPWGNQVDAMIEKCAMIGAGRKRLRLGNVLIDGEVPIYEQMGEAGPRQSGPPADIAEFPFEEFSDDPELVERLRAGALRLQWPAAKVQLVMSNRSHDELVRIAEQLEAAIDAASQDTRAAAGQGARSTPGGGSEAAGGGSGAQDAPGIPDAEVVPDVPVDHEKIRALEKRKARLEDDLNEPGLLEHQYADLTMELENVERELAAAVDPGQPPLFG